MELEEIEVLCQRILEQLEEDSRALSASLQGEILAEYDRLMAVELEQMRKVRRLFRQARAQSSASGE